MRLRPRLLAASRCGKHGKEKEEKMADVVVLSVLVVRSEDTLEPMVYLMC